MIIEYGDIIPGEKLGEYKIGMKYDALKAKFGAKHLRMERYCGSYAIRIENALFNFDSNDELIQVGVTKGFLGKLKKDIGIGSTLLDLEKEFGGVYEENDNYLIENLKGIAFELGDTEEDTNWNAMMAPIEWIYVYRVK